MDIANISKYIYRFPRFVNLTYSITKYIVIRQVSPVSVPLNTSPLTMTLMKIQIPTVP